MNLLLSAKLANKNHTQVCLNYVQTVQTKFVEDEEHYFSIFRFFTPETIRFLEETIVKHFPNIRSVLDKYILVSG